MADHRWDWSEFVAGLAEGVVWAICIGGFLMCLMYGSPQVWAMLVRAGL